MSKDDDAAGGGFSRIAGGLGDLINLLVDLDKDGDLPRRGRREKNGVVVEYSVGRSTAADPRARPPRAEAAPAAASGAKPAQHAAHRTAKRTDIEVIEPVTDMFDEPDETVLLFEIPGVSRPDVRCLLDGDILLLEARTDSAQGDAQGGAQGGDQGGRLYRKEVLIEAKLAGDAPRLQLRNGILEVRLKKQT